MEQEVAWSLVVSSWWPSYLMGPLLYGQILAQIKQANGSPLPHHLLPCPASVAAVTGLCAVGNEHELIASQLDPALSSQTSPLVHHQY